MGADTRRILVLLTGYYLWLTAMTVIAPRSTAVTVLFEISFFLVPAAALHRRHPGFLGRSGLIAAVAGGLYGLIYNNVARLTGAWTYSPVLPLGGLDLWGGVWHAMNAFMILALYAAVVDPSARDRPVRLPAAAAAAGVVGGGFAALLVAGDLIAAAAPAYSFLMVLVPLNALPIAVYALPRYREEAGRAARSVLLFAPLFMVYEILGMTQMTNPFSYPGDYVAVVTLFGARVPVEEVIAWQVLTAPAIIGIYFLLTSRR